MAERAADVRQGASWTLRQRLKNDLIYIAVEGALFAVLSLPRWAVLRLCLAAGALAYRFLGRERETARARLALGLGAPLSEGDVRAAFATTAATLADTLALFDPRERAGRTLTLDAASREVFHAALAEGRGVVFVTAHLGPWERMAALLSEEGFPVATVARESYDPRFTRLYERLRAPRGVRSIYRGRPGAAMAIARELRAGRAVGFLIDLPARAVQSERARLFGAAAAIPVGPARIALARRAAVVVGTVVIERASGPSENAHVLRAEARREVRIERVPADDLTPGLAGERALVLRLTRALDARIAAWPEAWLGLYAPPGVEDRAEQPPRRLRHPSDPR